eukprot:Hpha_TRINITY_DN16820_c3_g1::TRINITY_DN16820_c3_g1_i1::g.151429::m.151429/K01256/pepN; aminopeptidase N
MLGVRRPAQTALRRAPAARRVLGRGRIGTAVRGCAAPAAAPAAPTPPATPPKTYRKEYRPPNWSIEKVDLDISIDAEAEATTVKGKLRLTRRGGYKGDLILDAEELQVRGVKVDGEAAEWSLADNKLTVTGVGAAAEVETEVVIEPRKNLRLSGLYHSGSVFCTQCESEGFRRITPSLDRPDAMAKEYFVRVEADESLPVLLSNGNLLEEGKCGEGRHYALFHDPFPKPSYLFALVAGKLSENVRDFVTASGKPVKLRAYTEEHNAGKLEHALNSLEKAMKWDEETYGLEYDLAVFNLVAVDDFNYGAMENKGLNVFNTSALLFNARSQTDTDYDYVTTVVAHEYFHNWTGNRVTCQDWFQLSLKEGLTVFRDQQFSADVTSPAVKRIEDVQIIRGPQFAEDSGPMAHPVRPEEYNTIENFYTVTVYHKGAEVVGMYNTLLGRGGFRKGMDLYFKRHDGTAATCDDFRNAMADANGRDLTQFEEWYLQKGTPVVKAQLEREEGTGYSLTLQQQNGEGNPPMLIPFRAALLDKETGEALAPEAVLELTERSQTFHFPGVEREAVLSPLRGFSAPVKLEMERSDEDLALLMAHDTDPYVAWDAARELTTRTILAVAEDVKAGRDLTLSPALLEAFKGTLRNSSKDPSLTAYSLQIPAYSALIHATQSDVSPSALHQSVRFVRRNLAVSERQRLEDVYRKCRQLVSDTPDYMSQEAIGLRRLQNTCLSFIASLKDGEAAELCWDQLQYAEAMTDAIGAFVPLCSIDCKERETAVLKFYNFCGGDALALNKWFMAQATADLPGQVERVRELMQHKDFTLKNPNRLRSVLSAFGTNMPHFHDPSGHGYAVLSEAITEVDGFNPMVAAALARNFALWKKFEPKHAELMQDTLRGLSEKPLSTNTAEVVSRCLAA